MVDVHEWSRADTARFVRVPTPADDKYSRGVVGLRIGSVEYPGAAVLGVEAAWRAGAGFVRYTGPDRASDLVLARRPETVAASDTSGTRVDAWVIGSGTDPAVRTAVETSALRAILAGSSPVIVDAGALDLAPRAHAPLVVTPHAGEFARLRERLGMSARDREHEADDLTRLAEVTEVAARLGGIVLLKGARTLIADPDGSIIAIEESTGWLSSAGTGDVLAGVLGATIAANPDSPLVEAVAAGAWLHAYAGRLASGTFDGAPGHPIVALDVAEALPRAIADVLA